MSEIVNIGLDRITDNPNNPRRKVGNVDDLAASMDTLGLIEPIIVRALDDNTFVVIAGHRRLAAARKLKWSTVPCVTTDIGASSEALSAIAENTSRVDLSPEDLADAVGRLSGLEVTDDEIMASLSIRQDDLVKARTVAGATKTVRAKVKIKSLDRQMTLDEQAALVEFAAYPDALRRIQQTIAYRPDHLDHAIADERANLARLERINELTSMLKASKVKIIPGWARHESPPDAATLAEVERRMRDNANRVRDLVKGLGLEIGTEVRFLDEPMPLFVARIGTHSVTLIDVDGNIVKHADPEDIAPMGAE